MAGRIPQDFINDLLERADIVALIETRVPLKKAGKDYKGLCPFHSEKTPSFHVVPKDQFYHCFGCGQSGSALKFLMDYERLDFVEAVETLADFVGVPVPREEGSRPKPRYTSAYEVLEAAAARYERELRTAPDAIDYLKGRGLTGQIAKRYRIGFAPDAWDTMLVERRGDTEALKEAGLITTNERGRTYDRFRNRIMFPIRDARGRVIGFGGRVMGSEQGPKYLNSPETPLFKKSQELYGLYEARRASHNLERVLVVEGYMDVVALAQFDITNVVATLGTASGQAHFEKLFRVTSEVVCCFDGDTAGRAAAWKALESALPTLRDGRQLRFLFLPEGEDPDSLVRQEGAAAFSERLALAEPALSYLFRRLSEGLELESLEGRARLDSLVQPQLARLPEGVLRQLAAQQLAEMTGLAASRPAVSAAGPAPRPPGGDRPVDRSAPSRRNPGSGPLAAGAGRPQAGLFALRRRLLGLLLNNIDEVFDGLKESDRAFLNIDVEDPLAQIVTYKERHRLASVGEILGSFAGEPVHGALVEACQQGKELDSVAAVAEFREGLKRWAELNERQHRRKLIAQMDDDSDPETFLRYRSLNKNSSPTQNGDPQ